MLVEVEKLVKKPFSLVLAYPRPDEAVLRDRIRQLKELGISHVEFCGRKSIGKLNVLGKGHVGVVLAAKTESGLKVALKIRRVDADRENLGHEAEMLKLANSVGVGPELLAHTSDVIVMEFIEGQHLPEWLSTGPDKDHVVEVLRELFEKCWKLDQIGLDHGELSRAHSHVLVEPRGPSAFEPRLVDFESASTRRRPSNLTSICQYVFIGGLSGLVARIMSLPDREDLIRALRAYKAQMGREELDRVLEACGLIKHI